MAINSCQCLRNSTIVSHPEKAGEGIEFLWALIKNEYRRIPYTQKPETKEAFHKKVEELIYKTTVDSVMTCSRKARKYICAYNEIHQGNVGQTAVPMEVIERMQKTAYRQHRGVSYKDVSMLEAEINSTNDEEMRSINTCCNRNA